MGMAGKASFSYDVFLSFSGEDTRYGFTGYLYNALSQRGIHCFIDDKELPKGEELTRGLVEAIKESRIAIIVLSKNYAFSSFCLQELTTILECFNEKKIRFVIPVFYKVDPSDLRKGTGSYGEALIAQKNKFKDDEKVNTWREALQQAANIAGFHFKDSDGLYEYKFIEKIVSQVSSKIGRRIHATNYPVGLTPRADEVISRLKLESEKGVHMVGIYGCGGIGKTTIAREVYNSISDNFDGSCFLEDVRENSRKNGFVHLQKTVLSDILGNKDIKLRNEMDGESTIKQRLGNKKVLLVLDDVDQKEQLQKIAGDHDWFGVGSRVIITTQNSGLLKIHGDISKYEVELFSDEEARELLSWNAFKTNKVDPKYNEILNRAVRYASGLPLALTVIGSDLRGKEKEDCELILAQYGRISENKIQNILKVSFDSLDNEEKKIFLDIACCFGGYKLSDVEEILHAHHGSSMKPCIDLLIEKSLIKIEDGLVTLQGLIQDMGREIVQQEASEPGKRSRLWSYEDVVQVLQENAGTSKIQILVLDFPKDEAHSKGPKCEEVHWDGEAIKKMKNLGTLIIRNGCFSIGPKHLPNSLKVLKWSGYPSQSLPSCFNPKKLSILELPESHLKACQQIQKYTYLRVLDFGYSEFVTEIPDVTGVPNLEKLSFRHCENLTKIHDSVGCLGNLKILDAVSCKNLKAFPPIILISLEQLNLSRCSSLESFPEILGKMENIKELHIAETPINELPPSIQYLTQLRKLELQLCGMVQLPSSIVMLPELALMHFSKCRSLQLSKQDKGEEMVSMSSNTECLTFSCCNISDEFFPMGLTWFANVKDLNLSGNSFKILDACFKECHYLRNLKLDDCVHLEEIRGIPRVLETFSAKGCTSLRSLDLTVLPACTSECLSLKELILDDCVYLQEIKGVLPNLDHFSAKNCTSLTSRCTSMLMNQESVEAGNKMFSLPGTKIPEWFACSTRGDSILFWFRRKFPAISLCLVIGPMDEKRITVKFSPRVFINGNEQSLASRKVYEFRIATDHIFLFDIQLLKLEDDVHMVCSEKEWNRVQVSYADHMTDNLHQIGHVAKHSGIYVFKQTSMEDIQFSDPNDRKRKSRWETIRQLKEKHSLTGIRVSETQCTQNEQHGALLTLQVENSKEQFSSHSAQAMKNVNCNPDSMEGADEITKKKRPRKDQNMVQTIYCGTCSGDASLRSIREAINDLELLTVKDLSEVSSESAMQSRLDHLLVLLSTSSHPEVTVEVKEAIVEFKTKASATVESVNKLKNFEKHRATIQRKTVTRVTGKGRRIDLKNSKKKVSGAMKADYKRKKELEAEIETLKKQLAAKEMDLEQLVLNLKNREAKLSTCSMNCASLKEQARKLLKEADDLLTE